MKKKHPDTKCIHPHANERLRFVNKPNDNASAPVEETAQPQTTDTKVAQPMAEEMYTCPMHNEVMSDNPGICPTCEMKLVKQKMTEEQMKMMKEGTYTKP